MAFYRQNDSVLSEFLACISRFGLDRSYLPLLVECAKLTPRDSEEYELNPSLFVSTVYSTSRVCKCAPRVYAAVLVGVILESDLTSTEYLLQLGYEEVSMRIFAITAKSFAKAGMLESFTAWAAFALKSPISSAVEISTKLYLLSKCCHAFPEICDSILCDFLTEHSPVVVQICCCKLLKSMAGASTQTLEQFFHFLPQCPTSHAIKALHAIARRDIRALSSASELVPFIARDIVDRWNSSAETVKHNLVLLKQIVQVYPESIVCRQFLHFLVTLIENGESPFDSKIGKLCAQVLQTVQSGSVELIQTILVSIGATPIRLSPFAIAILAFISVSPEDFCLLRVSQALVDLSLAWLWQGGSSPIRICDLVAFIVQVDETVDCSGVLEFCAIDTNSPQLLLGIADILASILYTKRAIINPEPIWVVLENRWSVRVYDKRLLIAALRVLAELDEQSSPIYLHKASELYAEEQRQIHNPDEWARLKDELDLPISLSDLTDYPFLSPLKLLNT
jgi:hypothetical protein